MTKNKDSKLRMNIYFEAGSKERHHANLERVLKRNIIE